MINTHLPRKFQDKIISQLTEFGLTPDQIAAVMGLFGPAIQAQEQAAARLARKRAVMRECRARGTTRGTTVVPQEKSNKINGHVVPQVGDIYNSKIEGKSKEKERKKDIYPKRGTTVVPQADFDEFYQLYPRKKKPADALKAYHKARKIASKEDILQGVRNLIAENKELQFIPYPATWLNSQSWLDEVSPQSQCSYQARSVRL